MPIRFLVAPLLVLLLASSAAFASPSDGAIRAQLQLSDSSAAERFAEQLPRSLLFHDHLGTAQVAYLSEPLETAGVDPVSDYRAGDVVYWATGQSIVVFLTDGAGVPTDGLSLIGHISAGLDDLAGCSRNCPVLLDDERDGPEAAGRIDE